MTASDEAGQRRFDEATARASRMILAMRVDDERSYEAAKQELQGGRDVEDTMRSLAWVANESLKHRYDDAGARKVLNRLVSRVPAPAQRPDAIDDVWRDAVAILEAIGRDDPDAVRVLLYNSPSIDMLLGSLAQLLANVVERVDPAVVREVIEEARRTGPPPMTPP